MMDRFNKWYDALQEPWRFLLAIALIMSGIWALQFGNPIVRIVAAFYLIVLGITRTKGKFNAKS